MVRVSKYSVRAINGKTVYLHREVWEQHYGPIPTGYVVHHINEDHLDNRIENLKLLTRSEHTRYHSINRSAMIEIDFSKVALVAI